MKRGRRKRERAGPRAGWLVSCVCTLCRQLDWFFLRLRATAEPSLHLDCYSGRPAAAPLSVCLCLPAMDGAAGRGARKVAKIFFFPAHEEGSVLHVYVPGGTRLIEPYLGEVWVKTKTNAACPCMRLQERMLSKSPVLTAAFTQTCY